MPTYPSEPFRIKTIEPIRMPSLEERRKAFDEQQKAAEKAPAGVRKQIRRLERQLADAARQERKRLRKLERARQRRQVAEAALADVLAETPASPAPAVKPAPAPRPAPAAARRAKTVGRSLTYV